MKNDQIKAALLTLLAVLAIILLLLLGSLQIPPQFPPKQAPAELLPLDEETFIEPEIIPLGEEDAVNHDAPAPALKGDPEPAPVDKKPTPPKNTEKSSLQTKSQEKPLVASKKSKSELKSSEPSVKKEKSTTDKPAVNNDKERQKASSAVASKFSPKNGSASGSSQADNGSGGSATGIAGNATGRTFISCPKPDVSLRNKTVVTVSVVIDADGKVTEAKASGSASASIRRACEAAARAARWSAKKGASSTRGSITFTITPK